jgi:hypothetical protein
MKNSGLSEGSKSCEHSKHTAVPSRQELVFPDSNLREGPELDLIYTTCPNS